MGKRGITKKIYNSIEKGGLVSCRYDYCTGHIKKLKEKVEQFSEPYFERIITYCCDRNCFHNWRIKLDNFSSSIFHMKKSTHPKKSKIRADISTKL